MKTELKTLLAALAILATSLAANSAQAATYVIDSSQSSITITGLALNVIPIIAQSPGSNVAVIQGSIDADSDASTVTFTGGVADAVTKPGPFAPGPISGDPPAAGPNAPADVALFLGNASTGRLALRDFAVTLSGSSPLAGNDFDLTALTLTVTGGGLDYNVSLLGLFGHEDIAGQTASPTSGVGTLVGDTLTIPIDVSIEFTVVDGDPPGTAVVNLQGQIVATLVPEPGTIAMLGVGAVGLIAVGRRRVRRA
jgi:hypothetical protein